MENESGLGLSGLGLGPGLGVGLGVGSGVGLGVGSGVGTLTHVSLTHEVAGGHTLTLKQKKEEPHVSTNELHPFSAQT